MKPIIPEAFVAENENLCKLCIEYAETMAVEDVIARFASEEYKKYYAESINRKAELLAQGIIED